MKIIMAQMRVRAKEPAHNFEKMVALIEDAKKEGAHLIIFPEMAISGYFLGDNWEQASFVKECEEFGEEIAKLSTDLVIVFGNVAVDWYKKNEDGRARKYNALFVAKDKKFLANHSLNLPYWPKTLMPNYREFDDSRHFFDLRKLAQERNCELRTLLSPLSVPIDGEQYCIGLEICEDAWSQDYAFSPTEILKKNSPNGALDFFINISCSPFTLDKNKKRDRVFGTHAHATDTPFVHVNAVGMQNIGKTIYGFDGSSSVFSFNGNIVFRSESFREQTTVLHFDKKSREFSTLQSNSAPLTRVAETAKALEYIASTSMSEWNITKVVIGISGGIDSAVAAVLYSRILGPENVYLVNMPSKFNSQLTRCAAEELALNLDCPFAVVGIDESTQHTRDQLENVIFSKGHSQLNVSNFVFENIQARDRGARILAAISAALGAVIPCNANKAELTVGYSTLYGDLAGFLCVIGDLWKQDVYALAHFYNDDVYGKKMIPQATLDVVPSAELSASHDVTQNKGDPLIYPYHDALFRSWIEHWDRKTPFEILTAYKNGTLADMIGCSPKIISDRFSSLLNFVEDLEKWWRLYQGLAVVKRIQAPPIVGISRRAFGFDHRETLGAVHFGKSYEILKQALFEKEREHL